MHILPFGFGIDIVENSRNEFNDLNFANRFMTDNEIKQFSKYKNINQAKMYMIGIWSLKESIIKAINHTLIFSNINIEFTNEAPICIIDGFKLYLSLSYEKNYTIASCIAYKL